MRSTCLPALCATWFGFLVLGGFATPALASLTQNSLSQNSLSQNSLSQNSLTQNGLHLNSLSHNAATFNAQSGAGTARSTLDELNGVRVERVELPAE